MRVLVCGGRAFTNRALMDKSLAELVLSHGGISRIINGGAPGADTLARKWAEAHGIETDTFTADWRVGPAAGPIRNQRMIDEGRPDAVIAFPGGRGTADMVRRANAAGIPVREIPL